MANNREKGFMNIQLFAEPEGATTPTTDTPTPTAPSVDYESEYRKLQVEVEKYKKLKDDYAKESAGYKKQLADKMTDDEKNAQAQKEFEERMATLEAENKQMRLEREFMSNGFTAEECTKIISENFSPKTLAEIITTRVNEAVKSAKAEMIKETTPSSPMGKGTATGDGKSDFQKYQESKKQSNTMVEL